MAIFHLLKIRTCIDIFKNEKCKVTFGLEYMFEGNFLFNYTKTKTSDFCWHTNAQFWIKSTKLAPFTNCSSPFCESKNLL